MSWKDDKNLGPWVFAEQPDKWGYLNNPRWMQTPSAPINYSGNESNEPQIWTPAGSRHDAEGSNQHFPCGHWHKQGGMSRDTVLNESFYQQSIDVHHGRIAMAGMIVDAPYGMVCVEQRVDGTWYSLGTLRNMTQYVQPNTLRISSDDGYIAYYSSYYLDDDPGFTNYLGIVKFSRDNWPVVSTPWVSNFGSGVPYRADDQQFYNVMDCYGSRIACAALLYQINGVNHNKYQIKVSENSGDNWGTEWNFPDTVEPLAIGSYTDRVNVRMSQDGLVWVAYLRSGGPLGNHNIELWKSNVAATSWTKIWERNFYADLNNSEALSLLFDIEDEAAEKMSIRLIGDDGANYRHVCYYSTNYGVAFSTYTDVFAYGASPYARGTGNGQYVVAGSRSNQDFYRSTDGFDTYGLVNVGSILTGSYVDQQKHHGEIVYTECAENFGGADPNLISLLYSDDNGATWRVIQSPFEIAYSGSPTTIPGYPNRASKLTGNDGGYMQSIETTNLITGSVQVWNSQPHIINTSPGLFIGRQPVDISYFTFYN